MGPWSFYTVIRTFISPIDFFTDALHGSHLIHSGHPIWGVLTLILPLVALAMAFIYVGIGRLKRGESMTLAKFCILTASILTIRFEALFESCPQLVLQCTAIWRGVVKFEAVAKEPDFWGIFGLISMTSSFFSIAITATHYNDEKWDGGRSASKLLLNMAINVTGIFYRLFIGSLLFAIVPYWALGLTLIFYTSHLLTFKILGHSWDCVLYSYACLLFPTGHTKMLGDNPGRNLHQVMTGNSVSEVKRAKLNQESLYKQAKITFAQFSLLNLLALISYVALIETHLFSHTRKVPHVILLALNRLFIYLVPISLLIINAALIWAYVHHMKTLRDAVRTWDAITPSVPSSMSRRSTRTSTVHSSIATTPSSPPPPYFEQQLPLNPSYQESQDDNTISQETKLPKPGNKKCDSDNCVTCELLLPGTTFKSTMTGKEYKFMPSVSCHTKNIIYLVTCQQCKKQYIGKTAQTLKQRHYGHRREIEKQSSNLGQHFADACGYTSFRIQVRLYFKEETQYYI